jgi:RNA polymerase sigma-70 factor (sigma-E family)
MTSPSAGLWITGWPSGGRLRYNLLVRAGKPGRVGARRTRMAAVLLNRPGSRTLLGQFETATADEAVVELYRAHYAGLVRLSTMLVGDVGTAEEVVQDAFVAMHGTWNRLRDPEKALAYLRQAIVNRSRSKLRHRAVVAKYPSAPPPDVPSAEHFAVAATEREEIMGAIRALPRRQRETLLLRYYSDLSEAQIADTLGISQGAVKSHASRGLAALRTLLEKTS